MNKKIAITVLFVVAAIVVMALLIRKEKEPADAVSPRIVEPIVRDEKVVVQYPLGEHVSEKEAATDQLALPETLPELEQSDGVFLDVLKRLFASQEFAKLIHLDQIVGRIVVSVDNLTTRELPVKQLIYVPPRSDFRVRKQDDELFAIDRANSQRYAPYVQFAENMDVAKIVNVYVHFYPLFQQAYKELGYPKKYFNDRLVEVIDHLLKTPDISEPVLLKRPHVMFVYADPEIENLSSGQRLMLRVGKENRERIKTVLARLRAEILKSVTPANQGM